MSNNENFLEKYLYLKHKPLEVKEKDLSLNKVIRRKNRLSEDDVKPDFKKENLMQGFVEFPVLRNQPIKPLNLGATVCDYHIINHGGGVFEIHLRYGKEGLNPNDKRFRKPIKIETQPFYFHFDRNRKEEDRRYVEIKSEEKWKDVLEEIEQIKQDQEIEDLINEYYDFYKEYYSSKKYIIHKKGLHKFGHLRQNIERVIKHVKTTVDYYHTMLNIFGDIDDTTYAICKDQIDLFHEETKLLLPHLIKNFEGRWNEPYLPQNDSLFNDTTAGYFEAAFKKLMRPGFKIDVMTEKMYPNIGQIYNRNQDSEKFENEATIKAKFADSLVSAKRSYEIQIKQGMKGNRYIDAFME